MATRKERIDELLERGGLGGAPLVGLDNDARFWTLCRNYGDYSREVLAHLRTCSEIQRADRNHS